MAGPENQIATQGHPNPVPRGPGVSLGTGKHRYIFMDVSRLPGPRAARAVACSSSLSLARLGVKPCPAGRSAEGSFICVGRAQARASEDAGWLLAGLLFGPCLWPGSGCGNLGPSEIFNPRRSRPLSLCNLLLFSHMGGAGVAVGVWDEWLFLRRSGRCVWFMGASSCRSPFLAASNRADSPSRRQDRARGRS